jgi:hypothetical protein
MKKDLLFELFMYALCVTLAATLWDKPIFLMFCYVITSLFLLIKWHTRNDYLFYLVAFVLGPLAEFVAVAFGAWRYSRPFYLIPIWLPFLWGISALLTKNISGTLSNIRRK